MWTTWCFGTRTATTHCGRAYLSILLEALFSILVSRGLSGDAAECPHDRLALTLEFNTSIEMNDDYRDGVIDAHSRRDFEGAIYSSRSSAIVVRWCRSARGRPVLAHKYRQNTRTEDTCEQGLRRDWAYR